MTNPLISLIIPTYNVEQYIARCLESCINQSLEDIEILIIDDCGSDGSMDIAREYAKKDSRIRIIKNPKNLGTFGARIRGIEMALGLYMTFVDADDYLALNACELAYQMATQLGGESPDSLPDIVFFGMRFDPPSWKRISPPVLTQPLYDEEVLSKVFAHCATPPWHICAKLYKASHIVRATKLLVAHMGENVRLTMAEDVLKSFWLCALAKSSIGICDKLYIYCESQSSITRKSDFATQQRKIADISRVIKELEKLKQVEKLKANKAFIPAQSKAIAILQSVRELEYRSSNHKALGYGGGAELDICSQRNISLGKCMRSVFGSYLGSCLASLLYHRKWQTFARIAVYILSLTHIKL